MSFKKRATKSIVLALVGVTIATPMLNMVSAMEIENISAESGTLQIKPLSNDEVDSAIKDFQKQHGNEDKFKVVSNEDGEVFEVNGYRGILRISNYDKNNNLIDTVDINYFDNLYANSNIESKEIEDEPSTYKLEVHSNKTIAPDPFSIKVSTGGNYKSNYKITLTNWYYTRTFYKNDSSWNTGNTKGFNTCINNANTATNVVVTSVGLSGLSKIYSAIQSIIQKGPNADTILKVLELAGISISKPAVIATALATYCVEVNRAQYFWNQIF